MNSIPPPDILGCLLGAAVGDALGLPYEGLSRRRAERLLGPPDRHRFFFGRGMVSDDSEHASMTGQALLASRGEEAEFQRVLAWKMRWWLLGGPAGAGSATLRAAVRLWLGVAPSRSGVRSAGNGPAMRAAILGVCEPDTERLQGWVRASSRMTHADARAEAGALAVALAAQNPHATAAEFDERWRARLACGDGHELSQRLSAMNASVERRETTAEFAASLGLEQRVSGYVLDTVPVALHAWLTHRGDFPGAIRAAIECGGDTDTVAAIVGGVLGAQVGRPGIPARWLERLVDWPWSPRWFERLAGQLERWRDEPHACFTSWPWYVAPALLARNSLFAALVLFHGFRRLAPPY